MANDPILKSEPLGDIAEESSESNEAVCCGAAALEKAGKTWSTTQKIALGVEVAGGGPEDPVADIIAGCVEILGGAKALWDLFTTSEPKSAPVAPIQHTTQRTTTQTTTQQKSAPTATTPSV